MNPILSISLVTYNSAADLPTFFASLRQQTFQEFELVVVDCASTDNSLEIARNEWPAAKCIRSQANLGFSGGHNRALQACSGQYILIANVDLVLDAHFLEHALAEIQKDPAVGAVGGKLLKCPDLKNPPISGIIDSTGIRGLRERRFVDRGEIEPDAGQYDTPEDVFGVSGSLTLFRRAALADVRLPNGDYYDETYFMYQEDVDLAWRLQLRGWRSRYIPQAVAWHRRTGAGQAAGGNLATASHRRAKSALVNYFSYRNHLYTLIKNESDFWADAPWILWYEFRKLVYLLIFEQSTLRAWNDLRRQWAQLLTLRRHIQKTKTRSARAWFLSPWTSRSSS